MGKAHQIVEAEGAGAALDRMDSPEDGVDRIGIGLAILDRQQPGFQLCKLLGTFLEECLPDFGHRVHVATFLFLLGLLSASRSLRPAWAARPPTGRSA